MKRKFFLFVRWFFQALGDLVDHLAYWVVEICRRTSQWAEDMAHKID